MRTIVDLPEEQLQALSVICSDENISRAEAIRRSVEFYLSEKNISNDRKAFGLWKKNKKNALDYQADLREEW